MCCDWSIELLNLCSIVPVNTEKWLRRRSRNGRKNFPNFDVMSVFGLQTEGDNQNQNKTKSKTTKGNNSAEGEESTKKRRFAVVETGDLDALVEDSLAKKTKQATQWVVSVFTGRCQLRFKYFFHSSFSCCANFPLKKILQTRLISIKIEFY